MHLDQEFVEYCQKAQMAIKGSDTLQDDWRGGYGLLIEFFGFFPVPQGYAQEIGNELEMHLSETQARRQSSRRKFVSFAF